MIDQRVGNPLGASSSQCPSVLYHMRLPVAVPFSAFDGVPRIGDTDGDLLRLRSDAMTSS